MKKTYQDQNLSGYMNNQNPDDISLLKANEVHLNNEIMRLKSEIKLLSEINMRISKELIFYQAKLGMTPGDKDIFKAEIDDNVFRLPPQLHDFDFLIPLLTGYDDRINSLENVVNRDKDYIFELEKKAEKIVQDNNYLRQQLEKKTQYITEVLKNGKDLEDHLGALYSKLDKEDMIERMQLLSEENTILANRVKEFETRISQLSKTIDDKNEEISALLTRYSEVSKRNKELEFDIEDIRKAKDIIDVKYKNCLEDVNKLEIDHEELLSKINKLENEGKILKSQISSLLKNQSEFEEKNAMDIELFTKEIDTMRMKERELGNKLIYVERDLDSTREENRRLKKELENAKSDLDQMMKMMENFEAKVQFLQKKEENLQALAKQQKDKVEEALVQRDRALLKEENYQKTIEHLTEMNKQELKNLRDQHDKILESIRSKHKTTLEARDYEIKRLADENTKLYVQLDKTQKEIKNLKNELNKLNSILKEHSETKDDKAEDYLKTINELEVKIMRIEQENSDKIRTLTKEKERLEQSCNQYGNTFEDMKTALETLKSQNAALISENQNLKIKWNTFNKDKQNVSDEISKLKKAYEAQIAIYAEDYGSKIKYLEEQLDETNKKEKSTREKTIEMLKTHDKIEEKLRKELETYVKYYEKVITDLKTENKALLSRVKDMKQNSSFEFNDY